jgi:cellulose synthase/poly-beta-1,6-N-acetylglucosamine synthase-like glycosyltransferase
MKKILPIILASGLLLASCSSTKNMNEFYSKYDKEATVIPLPKIAINLVKKNAGNIKILDYINSAKIFIINDAGTAKQNRVIKDLQSATKGENFDQLTKLNYKKNNLNVSYSENNGKINQLILGINGLKNVLVIDSKVNLTQAELEAALDNIDLTDLEGLADILK